VSKPSKGLILASVSLLLLAAPAALAQPVCEGIAPVNNTSLVSVTVATGLQRPLFATHAPGDTDRLFIVEQDGAIKIKQRGAPPDQTSVFLDVSGRVATFGNEQGLLGLAFDPEYASNGLFYINYTAAADGSTVVARYAVSASDPDVADPDSEERVLVVPQPQTNHNAGWMTFGSDGYLYVALGDGGGGGDPHGECGNGQNTDTLLGSLLRLDVRRIGGGPAADCDPDGDYLLPPDNPFVSGGGCGEIWAYGVRNPWRNSFDPVHDDLYVADVGQNCWEELNWIEAGTGGGRNFGWRQMEASHCFDPDNQNNCDPEPVSCFGSPECNDPSLTDPVLEYGPGGSCVSITGGYVYRGCLMPNYDGRYFYGDYCEGFVRSLVIDRDTGSVTDEQTHTSELDPGGDLRFDLTSFGTDAEGELYIVDRDGEILKVLPPFGELEVSGAGAADPFWLRKDGPWTWEDISYTTGHPVDRYKIYRGLPNDLFECIHSTPDTSWVGDPDTPAPGEQFAYLVTAVNPSGAETRSGDPERSLSTAPCP
jgi:glucose/arabinose dehydrogenase